MIGLRLLGISVLISFSLGCASDLNYPVPDASAPAALPASIPTNGTAASPTNPADPSAVRDAPVLLGLGFGNPEEDWPELNETDGTNEDGGRSWYALTRTARIDQQQGKFEAAATHLEQAAMQLEARPPGNAQRRAVHAMRARLARDLLSVGQKEEADALAEVIFSEAESMPAIGGSATVDLALALASRRKAAAEEAGLPESQLPLLRIALLAAESNTPSLARMNMAYDVSVRALREGDAQLARRAIDRAVLDARVTAPSNLHQLASLKILKTRIAIAQGDLITAEASATSANRLFEEIDAQPANRAIAEATLARALSERGDIERARAIALGAQARLGGDPPIPPHAARAVLAEIGRLERAAGDSTAALDLFEQALDIPGEDFELDILLVEQLTAEKTALMDAASGEASDSHTATAISKPVEADATAP